MTSDTAAVLSDFTYRYPDQAAPSLAGLSWTVPAGAFVVVTGPSGSGKSTLLRCLNGLVPHFSGGEFGGEALVAGLDTRRHGPSILSRHVGFVFQDPEAQMVTTRVDDELAFGMEQLGVPVLTMRKRVEEVLDLLGIAALRHRDVSTLSGGERQRVAVAAALAPHPSLLVLDEPTSQLDPWGAEDVLTALTRLNDDLGLTIVLAEHRLERVIAHADQLRVLGDGTTPPLEGPPRPVLARLERDFLPPLVQVARDRDWRPLPLTIKAGRAALHNDLARGLPAPPPPPPEPTPPAGPPIVRLERVVAGYEQTNILTGIDLELRPGEVVALMGRNGSGKTTLLRLLMGLHRPRAGKLHLFGRDAAGLDPAAIARDAGYVPQNPGALLFAQTLAEEMAFTRRHHPASTVDEAALLARFGLARHRLTHPRDLSGGERQRAALAAILAGDPRLLLLDEPTRGMDGRQKRVLAELLRGLGGDGKTVVLATHDVELVASTAGRVLLLGDGRIVADGTPRQVLAGSLGYTTQVNKLFGGTYLTVEDVTPFR